MAEHYSLELLRHSGGISEYRYNEALEWLARWSDGTQCVATDRSRGKVTAHAAQVMRALDSEIRAATDGKESLDTLVQMLVSANISITNADFHETACQLIEGPVRALLSPTVFLKIVRTRRLYWVNLLIDIFVTLVNRSVVDLSRHTT